MWWYCSMSWWYSNRDLVVCYWCDGHRVFLYLYPDCNISLLRPIFTAPLVLFLGSSQHSVLEADAVHAIHAEAIHSYIRICCQNKVWRMCERWLHLLYVWVHKYKLFLLLLHAWLLHDDEQNWALLFNDDFWSTLQSLFIGSFTSTTSSSMSKPEHVSEFSSHPLVLHTLLTYLMAAYVEIGRCIQRELHICQNIGYFLLPNYFSC